MFFLLLMCSIVEDSSMMKQNGNASKTLNWLFEALKKKVVINHLFRYRSASMAA